jgi:hypothetical protein
VPHAVTERIARGRPGSSTDAPCSARTEMPGGDRSTLEPTFLTNPRKWLVLVLVHGKIECFAGIMCDPGASKKRAGNGR